MAKRMKLVYPSEPHAEKRRVIQWELCILCQQNTTEKVQFHSQRKGGQGENLLEFNHLGLLPRTINIDALDEGHGVEAAFIAHNACWHRWCRLMYNNTKMERARKRPKDIPADNGSEGSSGVSKRTRSSSVSSIPQISAFSVGSHLEKRNFMRFPLSKQTNVFESVLHF